MSLSQVREGIVSRLESIAGLRVYSEPPASVNQFPAAIIGPTGIAAAYDRTMKGGGVRYTLEVLVVVASGDAVEAWSGLEAYVQSTGAASVKAALDGDLNGAAHWARVTGAAKVGQVSYRRTSFWGAAFQLEVHADG